MCSSDLYSFSIIFLNPNKKGVDCKAYFFFTEKKSGLRAECVVLNNEKPCFEIVKAETRLLRATKQVSKKKRIHCRKT